MIYLKISKNGKGYEVDTTITNRETLGDQAKGSVYAISKLVDELPNEVKIGYREMLARLVNSNDIWYPEGSADGKYLS